MERVHARARRELLKQDERMGTLLSFSGWGSREEGSMNRILRALFFWRPFFLSFFAPLRRGDRPPEYLEGMIEPYREVKISSQVPGIIDEVLVERGDVVKKGQIVAKLRAAVEKANVDLAEAQVGFSKRKLEPQRGAIVCQGAYLGKRKGRDRDGDEEGRSRARRGKSEARNAKHPQHGGRRRREAGAAAGEYVGDKPILTIAQIDPLNVEVVVPVRRYGSITKGMSPR